MSSIQAVYGSYRGKSLVRLTSCLSPSESSVWVYIVENRDIKSPYIKLDSSMFRFSKYTFNRIMRLFQKENILFSLKKRHSHLLNKVIEPHTYFINPYFLDVKNSQAKLYWNLLIERN